MNSGQLKKVDCLFCGPGADRPLYPERLDAESFSAYAFSARRSRNRRHYRIVACETCGLVRSDPVLDEGRLQALYAESGFLFSEEEGFAAKTYARLLEKVTASRGGPGRIENLLEIGCSTGFFLKAALALGVREVLGFEPSRECVRRADPAVRARIVEDMFREERLAGRTFDFACAFHVVDHLTDPLALTRSIARHLRPGGRLLFVCHDVEAPSARLLGDFSPIFDVEHTFLFSPKTLRTLLERCDLQVIGIEPLTNTYPLGYWFRSVPFVGRAAPLLPAFLRNIPCSLKAGNLYALAVKKG